MGVSTGIQHNTVIYRSGQKTGFLQLVDQFALHIALVVVYRYFRITLAQLLKVVLERLTSINARFALTQQIQVWTVYNQNFHRFLLGEKLVDILADKNTKKYCK